MKPNPATAIQAQIRANSREVGQYFNDLREWEKDITSRDKKLESGKLKLTKERSAPVKPKSSPAALAHDSEAASKVPELKARGDQPFEEVKKIGNKYYTDGCYEEAAVCYTRLTLLKPKSEIAFSNRGMALLKLHRYAKAEADFTRALKNNPRFLKALHRRVVARKNQGKLHAALKDARQMIQLAPENAAAVSLHKQLKMAVRKYDEAMNSTAKFDASGMDQVEIISVEEGDSSGEEEDADIADISSNT